MAAKQTAAIVIPIYKNQLTDFEILSLKQCFKILSSYHIIFAAPARLDFQGYKQFCEGGDYEIARFDDFYFESIDGYNKLMLSTHFYSRFLDYKYILIYQLDAFVFKDELLYWCDQNYDYIGAPHVPYASEPGKMEYLKSYKKILRFIKVFGISHSLSSVGNGGLSLRKIKSFIWLLKILKNKVDQWPLNEDGFFEYWGNIFYPFFKLAPDEKPLVFNRDRSGGILRKA